MRVTKGVVACASRRRKNAGAPDPKRRRRLADPSVIHPSVARAAHLAFHELSEPLARSQTPEFGACDQDACAPRVRVRKGKLAAHFQHVQIVEQLKRRVACWAQTRAHSPVNPSHEDVHVRMPILGAVLPARNVTGPPLLRSWSVRRGGPHLYDAPRAPENRWTRDAHESHRRNEERHTVCRDTANRLRRYPTHPTPTSLARVFPRTSFPRVGNRAASPRLDRAGKNSARTSTNQRSRALHELFAHPENVP